MDFIFIYFYSFILFIIHIYGGRGRLSGKTTAIRLIAVRDTSVSEHHGALIDGPHETSRTTQHYRIVKFKGGPLFFPHYAKRSRSLGTADVIVSTL